MPDCSPKQLCFPPIAGQTIRADCEGGALSSDFGALLLRGIDRQIRLTERLAAAIHAKRHPSSIDHPLRDLLAQRIYQLASGYADANDAHSLRRAPLFTLGVERPPLDPAHDVASAPTVSRLEHHRDRTDLYRLTRALVDHFIASYSEPRAAIVLDIDHSDDPTYGSRSLRSIIITIRTIAISRSSFLKGRHMPGSRPICVRAPALPGPKMPCSWSGCCRICGATGPPPTFWSAVLVLLPPLRSST